MALRSASSSPLAIIVLAIFVSSASAAFRADTRLLRIESAPQAREKNNTLEKFVDGLIWGLQYNQNGPGECYVSI